jgi:hypothetical protein
MNREQGFELPSLSELPEDRNRHNKLKEIIGEKIRQIREAKSRNDLETVNRLEKEGLDLFTELTMVDPFIPVPPKDQTFIAEAKLRTFEKYGKPKKEDHAITFKELLHDLGYDDDEVGTKQ